jgi:hypothetical protein
MHKQKCLLTSMQLAPLRNYPTHSTQGAPSHSHSHSHSNKHNLANSLNRLFLYFFHLVLLTWQCFFLQKKLFKIFSISIFIFNKENNSSIKDRIKFKWKGKNENQWKPLNLITVIVISRFHLIYIIGFSLSHSYYINRLPLH